MAEEKKSNELTAMDNGDIVSSVITDASVVRVRATLTLDSQAEGKVTLFELPKGYLFLYGVLNTSVSLGTSTVAIGTEKTEDLYKKAEVLTEADVPTLFGKNAAVVSANEETQNVYLTVAAAALPASGTLVVDMYFAAIR